MTDMVETNVCVFFFSLVDVTIEVIVVDKVVEIGSVNVEMEVETLETVVVFGFGLTVVELVTVIIR